MFAPTSVLVSVQPEVPAIELGKSVAVRLWQTSPANGSFTVGAPRLRIGALGLALALPAPPAVPPPPPHAATNAAETTMSVAPLNRIRLLHHHAGASAPGRRTLRPAAGAVNHARGHDETARRVRPTSRRPPTSARTSPGRSRPHSPADR